MKDDTIKFIFFVLFVLVSTFAGFVGLVGIAINAWRNTLGMHFMSEWLFWAFVACFIPLIVYIGMFLRDQRRERIS